jgi:ketosteroid isomerase-like protein
MVASEKTKYVLGTAFHRALSTKDWASLESILSPEVTWTLPGDNQISGVASGVDEVVDRAELIASYGPSFELEVVLVSRENMALLIRNRAERGELVLDERVATVCTLAGDEIVAIETYLSDLDGMDAFFANLPA